MVYNSSDETGIGDEWHESDVLRGAEKHPEAHAAEVARMLAEDPGALRAQAQRLRKASLHFLGTPHQAGTVQQCAMCCMLIEERHASTSDAMEWRYAQNSCVFRGGLAYTRNHPPRSAEQMEIDRMANLRVARYLAAAWVARQ